MKRLLDWKVRGVRWIEIIGVVAVMAMVFSVYLAKTAAARESGRIGDLEREIAQNAERVRLLRAEAAKLEQPGRLEALSRAAGLGPVDVRHQATTLPTPAAPAQPRDVALAPVAPLPVEAPVMEAGQ